MNVLELICTRCVRAWAIIDTASWPPLCSLTALCTYNLLSKQEADSRWEKRLIVVSKLLGCYKVLQGAQMEET